MTHRIKGVVPVMVTPLDKEGGIDKVAVEKLIDHLVDSGCGAIWLLGSTGEDINLTLENRKELISVAANAAKGKIPVLAGTGESNVDSILNVIDEMPDEGISGVHAIYRDTKQGEDRVVSEIRRLADNSRFPIWLYNNVKRGRELTPNILRRVRSHPNIHGVKYGAFYHMPLIRAAMLQTDNFQVMSAGNFFFSLLCFGGVASTTSEANCWPEEYVKLYNLFNEGRLKEAREQQFRLIELASEIPRTDNGENCAEEKYILSMRGICSEYVNSAYRIMTDQEKEQIRNVLVNYGFNWVS